MCMRCASPRTERRVSVDDRMPLALLDVVRVRREASQSTTFAKRFVAGWTGIVTLVAPGRANVRFKSGELVTFSPDELIRIGAAVR